MVNFMKIINFKNWLEKEKLCLTKFVNVIVVLARKASAKIVIAKIAHAKIANATKFGAIKVQVVYLW